jgi:acyl carrier protein
MNAPQSPQSVSRLDQTSIQAMVLQAVRTANLARDAASQLEVSPTAPLFGSASPLDSIGLVALLLDIEEAFESLGRPIVLSDDRAVSQKRSPFRSVDSLVEYIDRLIQGA